MSAVVRAVVVDDEEPARELLRALLAERGGVEVVGEAGDGADAVRVVAAARPDVVFLDVQMPGMSGLDVAAALDAAGAPPLVVFVTAYDRYAIQAFEVSACDYLLKPFDAPRLATTVRRVLGREHPERAVRAALRALAAHLGAAAPEQVVVRVDGRHLFLAADEIEWVEAAGKDVRLHLAGRELLVRESISSLAERLDRARFVRVHRSAIVNRARIREMQPWFKGDYVVVMRGGARIVTGRTYRAELRRLLGP